MAATIGGAADAARYFGLGGDIASLRQSIACASANFALTADDPAEFARRCALPDLGSGNTAQLVALAALWLSVGVVYWLLPVYRIRRRRLRPLRACAPPDIQRTLTELVAFAELRCRVRFVVDSNEPGPAGLAFGRVGRRHVMLGNGLLRLHSRDPEAFRAIVLHELAHLRNRDVDTAFLTLICSRLFVFALALPIAVTAPFSLLISWELAPTHLIYQLLHVTAECALAVTVAHAGSAVLRSRELYADARVAVWTRGAHSLRRLLAAQHGIEQAGPRRRRLFRRTHPSAARRVAALNDTRLLFGFSPWEVFGLALTCSLVYGQVAAWTGATIRPADPSGTLNALVPAVLLGGGVAVGIWRVTLAAHLDHARWTGAHRVGLAMGCGLFIGTFGDERQQTAFSMGVAGPLTVVLSWWLLLGAVGYGFVRWNAVTARVWAPVVLGARRPLVPLVIGCATGVVLLSLWLGQVHAAGTPGFELLPLPRLLSLLPTPLDYLGLVFSLAAVLVPPPVVLAVIVVTVGFPLAARLAARVLGRVRGVGSTAGPERFLLWTPSAETSAALLAPPRLRPGRALLEGVVIGAVAGFGLWQVHALGALVFPWPIELVGSVVTLYFVPVAMLLQLAAGFLVARRTAHRELRAFHGVLAVVGAGLPLPLAAFTARDHFACLRWGLDHPACELVQPLDTLGIASTITAWTAAFALLLIPTWVALSDSVRR
ncbi:M48 family metalloprotease [Streptomyces sp. PTD5-9]|uniref:M48 family metalloprotease n=1 Tax=Streptomyces sp. PTD5-9 TaxID=3120150 RepID=UPI003008D5CA